MMQLKASSITYLFSFYSGILVSVTCLVRNHVRNPLLFYSQIYSEQGERPKVDVMAVIVS